MKLNFQSVHERMIKLNRYVIIFIKHLMKEIFFSLPIIKSDHFSTLTVSTWMFNVSQRQFE